jgi:hypothetical protein
LQSRNFNHRARSCAWLVVFPFAVSAGGKSFRELRFALQSRNFGAEERT